MRKYSFFQDFADCPKNLGSDLGMEKMIFLYVWKDIKTIRILKIKVKYKKVSGKNCIKAQLVMLSGPQEDLVRRFLMIQRSILKVKMN